MIEKKGARNFATFYLLSVNSLIYRAPQTNIIQLNSSGTKHELQLLYQSVKTTEYQLLKTKVVTTYGLCCAYHTRIKYPARLANWMTCDEVPETLEFVD